MMSRNYILDSGLPRQHNCVSVIPCNADHDHDDDLNNIIDNDLTGHIFGLARRFFLVQASAGDASPHMVLRLHAFFFGVWRDGKHVNHAGVSRS